MSRLTSRRLFSRAPRTLMAPQSGAGTLANGLLDQGGDLLLVRGGELGQRVGSGPHAALVEARLLVEAERGVARLELVRGLEEAHDLAVALVGRHSVPG